MTTRTSPLLEFAVKLRQMELQRIRALTQVVAHGKSPDQASNSASDSAMHSPQRSSRPGSAAPRAASEAGHCSTPRSTPRHDRGNSLAQALQAPIDALAFSGLNAAAAPSLLCDTPTPFASIPSDGLNHDSLRRSTSVPSTAVHLNTSMDIADLLQRLVEREAEQRSLLVSVRRTQWAHLETNELSERDRIRRANEAAVRDRCEAEFARQEHLDQRFREGLKQIRSGRPRVPIPK